MKWGCEAPAFPRSKDELEGQLLDRCPARLWIDPVVGPHMQDILWQYGHYKNGLLPTRGGLEDQPGLLIEIFTVIDRALQTVQAEKDEQRARDEAKNATRRRR